MVLIMTVNPGFGGQKFISAMIPKLIRLRQAIDRLDKKIAIEVDGGVNLETIKTLAQAGADIFVAGSAIFETANYQATITALRNLIDQGRDARESVSC